MSNELTTEKSKSPYWPIYILKKFVKKAKNHKGEFFYIVQFVHNKQVKEVYIDYNWLRLDKFGKGYEGNIKVDMKMRGTVKTPIEINSNEFLPYFSPKRMKRKRED